MPDDKPKLDRKDYVICKGCNGEVIHRRRLVKNEDFFTGETTLTCPDGHAIVEETPTNA